MSPYERINTYMTPRRPSKGPWRRRFSAALPWVFVLGMAAGTMLPMRQWIHWAVPGARWSQDTWPDDGAAWKHVDAAAARPVDVIRTIDGDTFEARVHLSPGLDVTTRV